MARKRKHAIDDDATLAGIPLEDAVPKKRTKPAKPTVAPWDRVAVECPCRASADAHRVPVDGIVRVHIESANQPILCVPGTMIEGRPSINDYAPQPMPVGWRKSSHYLRGELGGRL